MEPMDELSFFLLAWGAPSLCALVALILAIVAKREASKARSIEDELKADVARRASNLGEELRQELQVLRRQLATVAQGGRVERDEILEGRLWGEIDAREAALLLEAGSARFLDVRTKGEMAAGIVPGARLVPVDELEERWRELPRDGGTLVVYCAAGGRSAAACEFLAGKQHPGRLLNLSGGFSAWNGPRAKP
jgi:rhodanese-related sulfurtransferase